MRLFRYEGYNVVIEPEALTLKPFKKIWTRDKSRHKEKALLELGFIYFFCDPKSDYQYIVDEEARMQAIIEQEGMNLNWKPDPIVQEAMDLYCSFKSEATLLLEDTRFMIGKLRERIKKVDFNTLEIKEFKEVTTIIKQLTPLIEELDKAEKAILSEIKDSGRMRGSGEKSIMEDSLDI
jgi:hypothetical protein